METGTELAAEAEKVELVLSTTNDIFKNSDYRMQQPETPDTPIGPFSHEPCPVFRTPLPNDSGMVMDIDETPDNNNKFTRIHFIEAMEESPSTAHAIGATSETPAFSVDYFVNQSLVELGRCAWKGRRSNQRYLKGCLWSPDGTCVLTAVNGDGMHVFELPSNLYGSETVNDDRPIDLLNSAVHVNEAGIVYDYGWYPYMNSSDPSSCW